MAMYEKEAEFAPDNLFASNQVFVLTKGVVLEPNGILKRGSVLFKNANGKYEPVSAQTDEAECVLTDDIDTTKETTTTAYISGCFNKNALIFGNNLKYDDFDLKLRRLSIFAVNTQN